MCLLVGRSNSHLWLLIQCKRSGVFNQSHAHTNAAVALHNVVCSHMTADITDGQSLLIQTGSNQQHVCDHLLFRFKLQSVLEHKRRETLPWSRMEFLFQKRAGVSE